MTHEIAVMAMVAGLAVTGWCAASLLIVSARQAQMLNKVIAARQSAANPGHAAPVIRRED